MLLVVVGSRSASPSIGGERRGECDGIETARKGGAARGSAAKARPPAAARRRPPARWRDAARLLPDQAPDAALTATNGIFAGRDDAKRGRWHSHPRPAVETDGRERGRILTRPFGRTSCVARRGRWAAQRRKSGRTLERNYSHPRCADALAAAGGARCRSHRADGLHDDAVDRQLAAGAPAGTTSAATPGVIAGYYRVNPGDTLAGVANAYGSASGTWPAGTTWRRPMPCIPASCASRRRLPRRRSGSHLRRPHSRLARLRPPVSWRRRSRPARRAAS